MKYNPVIATAVFLNYGLPKPELEYEFACGRKWRFDFGWPEHKIALEVEGGMWLHKYGKKSGHFQGEHVMRDFEKYNTAAALGWRLIRCTPQQLMTTPILVLLKHAFKFRVVPADGQT